jgi:hypothetical protein
VCDVIVNGKLAREVVVDETGKPMNGNHQFSNSLILNEKRNRKRTQYGP